MNCLKIIWRIIPALVLAAVCPLAVKGETYAPIPVTARDCYNAGTKLLAEKKYADAEKMFETALANQDDRVQPAAMYNVGETRFAAGLDRLKQGPTADQASARGNNALAEGEQAIHHSESALANQQLDQMVAAYMEGRGARHDLREAQKAISAAMEQYGKTMDQWLRASEDFKGAAELNPADKNAVQNADTVDKALAKLVDSLRKMQSMMGMMGKQRQDLAKLLNKLKGQIPAPDAPPGPGGDDDDEDQGVKPENLAGQKENAGHEGSQMQVPLSPDQANQILNGLSIDGTRRLTMSDKEGTPPKDRKGRNW